MTLLEMQALIFDGDRGLTPPVYPLKSRSIKTRVRSAGTTRAACLFPFPSLSADLRDLCATCNPAPNNSPQGQVVFMETPSLCRRVKPATRWGRWEPRGTATMCFSGPRQMKREPAELRGPKTPRYILYDWRGEIK